MIDNSSVNTTVAGTYTVTYNGNGNTGGTAPIDASSPYYAGVTVTVLDQGSMLKTSRCPAIRLRNAQK